MPNPSGRTSEIAASRGVSSLLLEHHCRLASIDVQDRSRLGAASECQLAPRDYVIYRQGELADSVYLILSGGVTLERRDGRQALISRRQALLHRTFGDGVLIGEVERRHTAKADCAVVLVKMPPDLLREILTAYRDVASDWTFDILTRDTRAIRRQRARRFRYFIDSISAAQAPRNVIAAMRRRGVRRLVVQSSYGVGGTRRKLRTVDRLVFSALLKPQIDDTEVALSSAGAA